MGGGGDGEFSCQMIFFINISSCINYFRPVHKYFKGYLACINIGFFLARDVFCAFANDPSLIRANIVLHCSCKMSVFHM